MKLFTGAHSLESLGIAAVMRAIGAPPSKPAKKEMTAKTEVKGREDVNDNREMVNLLDGCDEETKDKILVQAARDIEELTARNEELAILHENALMEIEKQRPAKSLRQSIVLAAGSFLIGAVSAAFLAWRFMNTDNADREENVCEARPFPVMPMEPLPLETEMEDLSSAPWWSPW